VSAPRDDDPVGSSVQEAARLLVALVDRARENLSAEPGASGHLGVLGDLGGAGQAAECRWCPLCQAIAFVRATNPEVRQQVATAAVSLAVALRDLAESAAASPQPDGDDADRASDSARKDGEWD
jgi:hypothetical protein